MGAPKAEHISWLTSAFSTYGATKRAMDMPKWGGGATGAFGGAPYGATKRVSGVPKWGGGAMRTFLLRP
eukprot:3415028-Pyramimonas_sp.AAC.1